MSVIQKIRDKYATLMVVAICVSLFAFLLMQAFVGPKSFFNNSNNIANINGISISYKDFANKLQDEENAYQQRVPNSSMNDAQREQIQEQVWNEYVNQAIMGDEFKKLGIGFSDAELQDLTITEDADPQIKGIQIFKNPNTGVFDPNRVIEFIRQIPQDPSGQSRQQWLQVENYLSKSSKEKKFYSLVQVGIYYPKWVVEMELKEKNTVATASYVSVPYSTIPDSSIQVTNEELRQYITDHKADFQQEASRKIEFISFDAIPTAADSSQILKEIAELKQQMEQTSPADIKGFIARNSETPYLNSYLPENQIQVPNKDSILHLPIDGIFGPYYDNNSVAVAKMIDKKVLPDTVQVRHILITDTQNIPDTLAHSKADSIEQLIQGGADFKSLVMQFSDDQNTKSTGGEFKVTPLLNVPTPIKNFAFEQKKGTLGVVKLENVGYDVIQILDQKDFSPSVKVAYLSKHMDPSQETDNAAYEAANEFNGKYPTRSAFDQAAKTQGLNIRIADNIHPNDYSIPGIGSARDIIRWAFNDAKKGEESKVFTYNDKYVIAVLLQIRKKGIASLADVKPQVEAEVRLKKKAKIIAARIAQLSSLEAVAKTTGQPIQVAQNVNFQTPFIPNAGFEPKVVGAIFQKSLGTTRISSPIFGNNGVYVVKVDSLMTLPIQLGDIETEAKTLELSEQSNIISQLFNEMKKESDIQDNRVKFY
ncbi:MAG: peptidylprolyl isomerase [Chitinophagaceae bacterium]